MDAHLILFAVFIHRWFFLFLSVSSQNIISSIIFSLAQKIVSKSIYSNVNTQIWDHQSREMERAYRIYWTFIRKSAAITVLLYLQWLCAYVLWYPFISLLRQGQQLVFSSINNFFCLSCVSFVQESSIYYGVSIFFATLFPIQ